MNIKVDSFKLGLGMCVLRNPTIQHLYRVFNRVLLECWMLLPNKTIFTFVCLVFFF